MKLIEIDGWRRWVSEVDGGLIRDGFALITEDTPVMSNFQEQLTPDQLNEVGPIGGWK